LFLRVLEMKFSPVCNMIFSETKLERAYIIDLERREDHRGFFSRAWCQGEFEDHGLNPRIVQTNIGFTLKKGGLRGMHFQVAPKQEAKTVRCTMGAIFDVVIDLCLDSPTFKQWFGLELTAENRRMLYVPEGCAHGYQTLRDNTEIQYQTSEFYSAGHARGVRFDDPAFGIEWPLLITSISDADRTWPDFHG
jgi:dTDP-4-dehydrorhamnose 3,5-epimerase